MPDQNRNPNIEKLLRWVMSKAAILMTDATRWELVICGKGDKYTCRVTVYEDP